MKVVLTVSALVLLTFGSWAEGRLEGLDALGEAYPRAVFFRVSEAWAAQPRITYDAFDQAFSRLDGIIGKCFDEEVPGRQRRNLDFFTRFKERHPEKLVLLHFNGNSRDPGFVTGPYFAGHWLYFNGCGLTQDVAATPDSTTFHVEDTSLFSMSVGLQRDEPDAVGVCQLDESGRPDWAVAEQVLLTGIDAANGTITVRRGTQGTAPRAWRAGETYIAAHVMEGPWGRHSNMLWTYNYATMSPKDDDGKQCADLVAEDFGRWFDKGGVLDAFDGVEFDVLFRRPFGGNQSRGLDVDADGKRDDVDGDPTYETGVLRFLRLLRERIGDERLILADGHEEANQRAVPYLNGIESEGWPHLRDVNVGDWSGGMNRHNYWRTHARTPRFSYINHKFVDRLDMIDAPINITRLVMAAAVMTDAVFTYSQLPEGSDGSMPAIWDELIMGEKKQPRWLGKALTPPLALALEEEDLLAGLPLPSAWERDAASGESRLVLPAVDMPGGDLVVRCVLEGEPLTKLGAGVPRLAHLQASLAGQLVLPALPRAVLGVRGKPEEALAEPEALFRYMPSQSIAGESHEAYFAHPPYGPRGTGYLAWERTVTVPEQAPLLVFHTGLRETPNLSDGVVFSVQVESGGEVTEVFSHHQKEFAWKEHQVALSAWAGKDVRLRFTTDCGPDDNPTSDHAFWGDVYVAGGGQFQMPDPDTPSALMTWVGETPFESRFYFRDLGRATVRLVLTVEGLEPVRLTRLTAHAASDVMVRQFENGLVLANPANHPYTFDLVQLAPGNDFRRLRGRQDPVTNDGSRVGEKIAVPPKDALLLVKVPR